MVDVATAERQGVCPVCEGYGGAKVDPEECANDEHHPLHSCEKCWCEGCHDGLIAVLTPEGMTYRAMELSGFEPEELSGSFGAWEHVREFTESQSGQRFRTVPNEDAGNNPHA